MKFLKTGLSLAVLGATLSVVPGTPSAAVGGLQAADQPSLERQMRSAADGNVRATTDPATGRLAFVRAVGQDADLLPGRAAPARSSAVAKARAYLDTYAPAFGARPAELVQDAVVADRLGTTVTYRQEFRGIPVFAGALKAHLDPDGDLVAVNGQAVPTDGLSTETRFSAAEAGERAVATVLADPPGGDDHSHGQAEDEPAGEDRGTDLTDVEAKTSELVVYREGLVRGVEGPVDLVHQVEVTNERNVRDMVFVSATTGKVVNRYSMIHDAVDRPDRELYEARVDDNETPEDDTDDFVAFDEVWIEGDDLPGDLNVDQENLVRSSGESFWFFRNAFGRNSWDGNGATMRTVNNDPRISCPNANWNGVTTNYCDGVTSDDVVSHEWAHAYTERTSGLIYQWQPGALNEAYSDIWGETLDLVNGREDEGEGDIEAPRTAGQCSSNTAARPLLTINSPSTIAKDCLTGGASFGEQLDGTGITGDVVPAVDAVEEGGTATDGCSPYDNQAAAAGKVVLVDRGLCPFTQKAEVATAMGAAALIIGNRDDAPIGMSGDNPDVVATVSIGLTDRELIRSAVAAGQTVNVTMRDAGGDREDSFRWLVGEKSTAFGGAIRDMWNPTCLGDPGKVSDAEYKCSTDDNGGVHSNSGVPNFAYALLVDGGASNGQTVRGLGLEKAAALYWRTQSTYLTPASDFVDLADGLEASCAELVDKKINVLSTAASDQRPFGDEITPDDCVQVTRSIAAAELRLDPTEQCDFKPLLAKNAPALCGAGFETDEVFTEDFEDGIGAWELTSAAVYEGGITAPWRADRTPPEGNETMAAYAPAGDLGDCSGTSTDFSSQDWLTSPDITVPADGQRPVMSFRHYVATEVGYDGGNVQVSVNGGEFAPVPAAAFTFNEPTELTGPATNTNPLAGQPGFTGTDGGEVSGSWGESQVDLEAAGLSAGDTLRLRFAMGRDGCGGIDGWYVDDVVVATCVEADEPSEPTRARTTTTVKRTWPAVPRRTQDFTLVVAVDAQQGDPTGWVRVTRGRDLVVGRAKLDDGVARVRVRRDFRGRKVVLRAAYQGTARFTPSLDWYAVRFKR